MGYAASLIDIDIVFDDTPVNYVAGCLDAIDSQREQRNISNPRLHFTIETWMMGIQQASNLPEEAQPVLVGGDGLLHRRYLLPVAVGPRLRLRPAQSPAA